MAAGPVLGDRAEALVLDGSDGVHALAAAFGEFRTALKQRAATSPASLTYAAHLPLPTVVFPLPGGCVGDPGPSAVPMVRQEPHRGGGRRQRKRKAARHPRAALGE
ncbi:hypothetical protein ABZ746_09550 [Streptomyces sp. NPDC020096]